MQACKHASTCPVSLQFKVRDKSRPVSFESHTTEFKWHTHQSPRRRYISTKYRMAAIMSGGIPQPRPSNLEPQPSIACDIVHDISQHLLDILLFFIICHTAGTSAKTRE